VAVFFGLSGTGKTTLSTDPKRRLIGDDEHGWDDDGVFNFEGGCYAKTIKLSKDAEPEIYNAIRRDALLENVTVREDGSIDFDDGSKTENTRVSYPIYHIDNIVKPVSKAGHATKVIFLTADAFGVLPPVSRLTADQTQYHFLSGFTAKLAGTERGVTEPTPTFSACFGAAFLSLHPTQYAEVLVKRMQAAGAQAYLVNTGWNGTGKRISIKDTRAIIDAILNGSLDDAETFRLPMFDLAIPTELPGVDTRILDPRNTYASPEQWQEKANALAKLFIENFEKYTDTLRVKRWLAPDRSCNENAGWRLPHIRPTATKRRHFASLSYTSFVIPCARVKGTGSHARIDNPPRSLVPISSMPLWLSIIRCTIARPSPVPLVLRALSPRTNGWNRCLRCSGLMPGPSSSTWNQARCVSVPLLTLIQPLP
jgi:hypothetical protein